MRTGRGWAISLMVSLPVLGLKQQGLQAACFLQKVTTEACCQPGAAKEAVAEACPAHTKT